MAGKRNWDLHNDKQRRLLDLAALTIVESGFESVSLHRLGILLGGAGYAHLKAYGSREELLAAVLDRQVVTLLEAVRQPEDWPGKPADQLAHMAAAYASRASETRYAHRVLLSERLRLLPNRRDAIETKLRWLHSAFDHAVGRAAPAARADAPLRGAITFTLLALLDTQTLWHRHDCAAPDTYARAVAALTLGRPFAAALRLPPAPLLPPGPQPF